jgi:hypothetical protein
MFLNISADITGEDDDLWGLISSVSKHAETYLNRFVGIASYTEYFTINDGDYVFSLKAYPVSSTPAPAVYNDACWVYTTALGTTTYKIDATTGLLYVVKGTLTAGFKALKVVYTGGMGATPDDLMTEYPDLVHAVERQVAFYYRTKTKIGAAAVNTTTGGVSFQTGVTWLDEVKAVLDLYMRPMTI